jgi:hypothetical protein
MWSDMKPALRSAKSTAIVVGAVAFTTLAGFWVFRASASQLSWLSNNLVRFGGLGLLFVAGVIVGVLLAARFRGGWGDDGGGQSEPWTPPPDDIELELQRIIEEQQAQRSPRST